MDRHEQDPLDEEQIDRDRWARANMIDHALDLEIQDRYGVNYLTYWSDPASSASFCLASGPNAEAVAAVHRESHGDVAAKIIEVDGEAVHAFIGKIVQLAPDEPFVATAFRAILFTDMEGSTSLTQRLGDARAMRVLRTHDSIVRSALKAHEGVQVKHTGDGMMASFTSVTAAVSCAVDIQRNLARYNETNDAEQLHVRVGISAGSPSPSTTISSAPRCSSPPGCAIRPRGTRSVAPPSSGSSWSARGSSSTRGRGGTEGVRRAGHFLRGAVGLIVTSAS